MKFKSYGEKSFSFYGPMVWNSLPFELRGVSEFISFKKQLKHFFSLQHIMKKLPKIVLCSVETICIFQGLLYWGFNFVISFPWEVHVLCQSTDHFFLYMIIYFYMLKCVLNDMHTIDYIWIFLNILPAKTPLLPAIIVVESSVYKI